LDRSRLAATPELSHSQVQTLLGSIGVRKGYDIWVPPSDRNRFDWSLTDTFDCSAALPLDLDMVKDVLMEIDVIWVVRGAGRLHAMFEVEHSTPIYSGLLRFNDIFLTSPRLGARFTVVSNDERRSLFTRQLNRPTFKLSKLDECCTFLDYASVYSWHQGLKRSQTLA
jgi:type II restriction enzyme